jgi:hypothetical protein
MRMTEAYFADLRSGRDALSGRAGCEPHRPCFALAAEGEQSACSSRDRAGRVTGEAVRCLLAPAGDAHQDDGGEWNSHRDQGDRHTGGYPDLMHVSSVLRR